MFFLINMTKHLNLTNQRFYRLTVIHDVGSNKRGERLWLCKCRCGRETIVKTNHLTSGHTKSCGGPCPNRYVANGQNSFLILQYKHHDLYCFIDPRDYDAIKRYHWNASRSKDYGFYALTTVNAVKIKMHRLILPGVKEVDHKDGNGLNNRRANLRSSTRSQSRANSRKPLGGSSNFKGVFWSERNKKFRARIQVHGKRINLGLFEREEQAGKAYDIAARIHFGEFARLNFPNDVEQSAFSPCKLAA